MENALRHARGFNAPVIVHVVTRKGMGYPPAENDEAEQMHSCGVIDPDTGLARTASAPGWTSVFSDDADRIATKRRDIVAITAAMPGPDRPVGVRAAVPGPAVRCRDRRAARDDLGGRLAMGGMHPVVAIYSTFLNRAFDHDDGRRAA